jgi:putative ABC transport system permease protein
VGKTLKYLEKKNPNQRIIGVVRNMVMESPFDPAKPTVFILDYEWANVILVKINPQMSLQAALPKIAGVFKKYNPGSPFDYQFADKEYARKFASEERIGKLASFFAVLAILISCLGLFGLASFIAEQRTKEIGIRKVLGASVASVWGLLSRDFVVLVLISLGLAAPLSFYIMRSWIDQYSYHTYIGWGAYALVGLGTIAITLATVGFQSIRAALANPVNSLRSE